MPNVVQQSLKVIKGRRKSLYNRSAEARAYVQRVAEIIKRRREHLGVSQLAVARKVGISQPAYCKIENGEIDFSVNRLRQIGAVLRMEPHEILDRAEGLG